MQLGPCGRALMSTVMAGGLWLAPTLLCTVAMENSNMALQPSALQEDLLEAEECKGSCHGHFRLPLLTWAKGTVVCFHKNEAGGAEVFPMKTYLCHVKEQAGTTALNFSTKDCLFFMQVMEKQPVCIVGPQRSEDGSSPATAGHPPPGVCHRPWTDPTTLGMSHLGTGGCPVSKIKNPVIVFPE